MKKLCRQTGKIKYRSHEHALKRGGKILESNKEHGNFDRRTALRAYHCPYGGHWHLTSQV